MTRMNRNVDASLDLDAHESHSFDRRTLVVSAAGALVAAALGGSARAAHFASSAGPVARAQFDPALARRLQQVLDDVVANSGGKVPGAILYAERRRPRQLGRRGWARSAPAERRHAPGRSLPGRQHREAVRRRQRCCSSSSRAASRSTPRYPTCSPPMWSTASRPHPGSRFGCCLVTEAVSPTGAPRPRTSPPPVIPPGSGRYPSSLDLAAAKKPLFAPGTRYAYSNTEYTLLGLVIEHATGRSWQQEVTDRVIRPLGLGATVLPAAGNRSWMGPYAHGYMEVNGKVFDVEQRRSVDGGRCRRARPHHHRR